MIIRSTHDCIYEASDAEIALQKLKGYKVDPLPYWKTLEHGLLGSQNINLEGRSKGGKIAGLIKKYNLRKLTQEQAEDIRSKYIPRKYTIKKLAKEYNVSNRTISCILKNINYTIT